MNERERHRETELTNSHDGCAMGGGAVRLEIEIYDIENDYDGDRARSRFALSPLW